MSEMSDIPRTGNPHKPDTTDKPDIPTHNGQATPSTAPTIEHMYDRPAPQRGCPLCAECPIYPPMGAYPPQSPPTSRLPRFVAFVPLCLECPVFSLTGGLPRGGRGGYTY